MQDIQAKLNEVVATIDDIPLTKTDRARIMSSLQLLASGVASALEQAQPDTTEE
jgi:hypothetical protein